MPLSRLPAFVVRYKNGQGTFAWQIVANNQHHAASLAKKRGKVLSVRKLRSWEVIGLIEEMNLDQIVLGEKVEEKNPMLAERSLEEILFPRKSKRRFNDRGRKDTKRGEEEI